MASVQNHGGGCCGVRHMYGMDNTTVADVERMIASVDRMPNVGGADSGRLIEVILSQRQVGMDGRHGDRWADCVRAEGGWPAVMQRLGFRLVSRFNNANSGYDCFVFHRVPHFKSIATRDLPFTWDHGAFASVADQAGGPGRLTAAAATTWNVGDRIRYGGTNGLAGLLATITNVRRDQYDGHTRYDLRFDNGELRDRYTSTYFERVNAPAPAPAAPVVRTVATFFRNRFADGRDGALYPNVDAARRSAPRCQRQERVEIRSDGTINVVTL